MSINLTSLKCPECAALLPVPQNKDRMFCAYCGASIIITNENEYTIRFVDEARIKEAEVTQYIEQERWQTTRFLESQRLENERVIRSNRIEADYAIELKKLEFEEDKHKKFASIIKAKILLTIFFFFLGFLPLVTANLIGGCIFWFLIIPVWAIGPNSFSNYMNPQRKAAEIKKVKVPSDVNEYRNKTYVQIRDAFRRAGFKNIECRPEHDLIVGLFKRPERVSSIQIDGELIESGGQRFYPDVYVVITYHSF